MKKLLAVCFAALMIVSLSVASLAAPGGFVSSPSGNQAPVLIDSAIADDTCKAEVIVTAYAKRGDLSEDARKNIEAAYTSIVGTEDLGTLSDDIKEAAELLGINSTDFAVSDLFDISLTACEGHEAHGAYEVKLEAATLKNFACLIHYVNGSWEMIEDAEIDENGYLVFTSVDFHSFAIVAVKDGVAINPKEDVNALAIAAGVGGGAVGIGGAIWLVLFLLKRKKLRD